MIYISHRGNTSGKDKKKENHPDLILNTLKKGFDVEVDVWFENNVFSLGHDNPEYEIKSDFLKNNKLWCHAKNLLALDAMKNIDCHFFWHEEDKFTLTSKGYIWSYPGNLGGKNSIFLFPENYPKINYKLTAGICSDFIEKYV